MKSNRGGPRIVRRDPNVARPERIASVTLGAALVALGVRRRDLPGIVAAIAGGVLVHRGATGRCPVYTALDVDTASASRGGPDVRRSDVTGRAATVNARKATKVERAVTIAVPRAAVYAFWRDFENLPLFMDHLESVEVTSPHRSRWRARAGAGASVDWDAELVNDVPGEIIAWKTVGHPDVAHAGAVNFSDAPGGRGTIVRVTLDYEPPAGRLGNIVAKLLRSDPDRQVRDDLRKLKQLMESAEITTPTRPRAAPAPLGAAPTG